MKSLAAFNLSGGVIAFVLILARTVPGWAQSHYRVDSPSISWSELTLHDPSLGTKIADVLPTPGPRIILVVGDCGQCNRSKVAALAATDLPSSVRRTVLVANVATQEEIESRFGRRPEIEYAPLGGQIKAALNVSFMPRVYLLDESGELRYVQSPSLSYGQAFWTIGRALRANR